jgi:hypothetical protein
VKLYNAPKKPVSTAFGGIWGNARMRRIQVRRNEDPVVEHKGLSDGVVVLCGYSAVTSRVRLGDKSSSASPVCPTYVF